MSNSVLTNSEIGEEIPLEHFCRKSIRKLLKCWGNVQQFSNHPLIQLHIVDIQLKNSGYADTPNGRGMALQEVLRSAIEALKPSPDRTDYHEKCWRPYLFIKEQYLENRSPDYLAAKYSIERSTYNHEQAKALDMLADLLYKREAMSFRSYPSRLASASVQSALPSLRPSFLAPARPAHAPVGRCKVYNLLKQQLMNCTGCNGVALRGMVGVGKTALSIALAHDSEILNHFQDGILWANLGQSPDMDFILDQWSSALGVNTTRAAGHQTIEARLVALHNAIGMRRMLIVIDDARRVKDALLFKIGGPRCAHLLTTRVPEVAMEFTGHDETILGELNLQDSLALLRQMAPNAVDALNEKADELASFAAGLPLALVFIGKHLRKAFQSYQMRRLQKAAESLTSAEIRLQLASQEVEIRNVGATQGNATTSLKQILAESEQAICQQARQTLRMLSVFPCKPNTFSEEAALAVSGAGPEILDELCDQGFIESDGAGRYTIHQVLADYGRSGLNDTRAYEQFVRFFVDLANSSSNPLKLYGETTNIFAALEYAYKLCMFAELTAGVLAFFPFLEQNELLDEAEVLLWRAQQATREIQVKEAQDVLHYYLDRLILRSNVHTTASDTCKPMGKDSPQGKITVKEDRKEALQSGVYGKNLLRILENDIKISYSPRTGTWFAHRVTNE